MIIYFMDRNMECVSIAGTSISSAISIESDRLTESIESQSKVFEVVIGYNDESRKLSEVSTDPGNYMIRVDGEKQEFFTIVDYDQDTREHTIEVYGEGVGIDLINDLVEALNGRPDTPIDDYVEDTIQNTDFEIGVNEKTGAMMQLSLSEQTVSERLKEISKNFGCEISYRFEFDGQKVTGKYIDIFETIGTDTNEIISIYKNLSDVRVKKTIANLCTSLLPEGASGINLAGSYYDNGDFYIDGKYLRSRSAVAIYGRYSTDRDNVSAKHISKKFKSDAKTKIELLRETIEELKRVSTPEVNYEVEVGTLPEGSSIGDRVNLVDDHGEIYVSARLLEIQTDISNNNVEVVIGDYLIKDDGISDKVSDLAKRFAELHSNVGIRNYIRNSKVVDYENYVIEWG